MQSNLNAHIGDKQMPIHQTILTLEKACQFHQILSIYFTIFIKVGSS